MYDGQRFPLKNNSIDCITTYVVLNYIINNDHLAKVLKEAHRVLKDTGKIIAIEQTRLFSRIESKTFQNRRSVVDYSRIFESAGFNIKLIKFIRHARFPLIFLIRAGLITDKYFETVSHWDEKWASLFSKPLSSYVDTVFILTKA